MINLDFVGYIWEKWRFYKSYIMVMVVVAYKRSWINCFGLQDWGMRTFPYHFEFTDFKVNQGFLKNLEESIVLAFSVSKGRLTSCSKTGFQRELTHSCPSPCWVCPGPAFPICCWTVCTGCTCWCTQPPWGIAVSPPTPCRRGWQFQPNQVRCKYYTKIIKGDRKGNVNSAWIISSL